VTIDENNKNCDLCGLAVEVKGFSLKTRQGDKHFCCEGCKGIYQMLHEAQVLPEDTDDSAQTKS
jgi:endogenous inhibitor of DNA gyrase (YacG/DUF329 family)